MYTPVNGTYVPDLMVSKLSFIIIIIIFSMADGDAGSASSSATSKEEEIRHGGAHSCSSTTSPRDSTIEEDDQRRLVPEVSSPLPRISLMLRPTTEQRGRRNEGGTYGNTTPLLLRVN